MIILISNWGNVCQKPHRDWFIEHEIENFPTTMHEVPYPNENFKNEISHV